MLAEVQMNPASAADFLGSIWGADKNGNLDGVHYITEFRDTGWQHHPVKTINDALAKAVAISTAGRNAYFACAEFLTAANRKGENATGAHAFWLDIDCGEAKASVGKGYATKSNAVKALVSFCGETGLPSPSTIINSGNGLHVYWHLSNFIQREEWYQLARKLKALASRHGLMADPSRTADIASVLRVPGTNNCKDPANPKPVSLLLMGATVESKAFSAALDAATEASEKLVPAWAQEPAYPPMLETPKNIARTRDMLTAIPATCDRDTWRNVVWALVSTGWNCAEELAREWSQTAPDQYDEIEFQKVVGSFKPDGGIGFGTLVHFAKTAGWQEPAGAEPERFTGSGGDVANGRIFARMWRGKLLHVHETGDWLRFDEQQGWALAPPGEQDRAAKGVLEQLREIVIEQYKAAPDDPKTKRVIAHVERTSRAGNLRAMIEMAQSEFGMSCRLNEFDQESMLLGVANGVLNLHTGRLSAVSPEILVSKRCNAGFDESAKCPIFHNFLAEVQPDEDMRVLLQRFGGYCLTGSVESQKFLFLHGSGSNGKSVFVELLAWLLGDYARKIPTEMLMHHQRSPQGPSPDIVALKGVRLAYANETEEGRRLAEARVKDMTGGDTLTGRVPYGKADITFTPTHKLCIVGNHRPEITDTSFGMWRRVALIPFEVTISEGQRDPRLLEKLKAEGAGILNWALEGLRHWERSGLAIPKKVEAATAAYRDDQDIIGEWLSEHCSTGPGQSDTRARVYRSYRAWSLENGHHPMAQKRLTRRLSERGFSPLPDKRSLGGLVLNKEGQRAALS